MAENVESRLEHFVPTFEQLISLNVFTRDEVKAIIKKRRNFEYSLVSKNVDAGAFLSYIRYEQNVIELTNQRKELRGINSNERLLSDVEWPKHIHSIFKRATHRLSGNMTIWNLYFQYCQDTKAFKALSQAFAECIRLHSEEPDLWIQAAKWEMDGNGNAELAMQYAQQAIKIIPECPRLYVIYAEAIFKQAAVIEERRSITGVEETSDVLKAPLAIFEHGLQQLSNKKELLRSFIDLFKQYEKPIDALLELAKTSNDAGALSLVASLSDDPDSAFQSFPKSHAILVEYAKWCASQNKKEQFCALLDEIGEFDDSETEEFVRNLIDMGALQDADDMLDNLTTPTLVRLKLEVIMKSNSDFETPALQFLQSHNKPELNSDFLLFVAQTRPEFDHWLQIVKNRSPFIEDPVPAKLLQFTHALYGPEKANELLKVLIISSIPTTQFTRAAIEIIKAQPVVDVARIRVLHDSCCARVGKTDVDAWMDWATFEHDQKELKRMNSVRWKAVKELADSAEFERRYQEKFCK